MTLKWKSYKLEKVLSLDKETSLLDKETMFYFMKATPNTDHSINSAQYLANIENLNIGMMPLILLIEFHYSVDLDEHLIWKYTLMFIRSRLDNI